MKRRPSPSPAFAAPRAVSPRALATIHAGTDTPTRVERPPVSQGGTVVTDGNGWILY